MIGNIVNALAIIAGGFVGILCGGIIPDRYNKTVVHAISLAVLLIGIRSAMKSDALLVIILSLALGSLLGEMVKIEDRMVTVGKLLEKRFAGSGEGFYKGFVTATLLYCVGSMGIVGALESGLTGDHQTLFAKSALDGIFSIILGSSMGLGVVFSAFPVLIYQGLITLAAVFIRPYLQPDVVAQMSAVGGVLIMAIGFNFVTETKIRIGSMIPAVFLPLVWYVILEFVG